MCGTSGTVQGLVGKREGRRPLGRPRCKCEDIKMEEVGMCGTSGTVQDLVGKREGRRPLGRPRCKCEDIKMDLNVVGIDIVHRT